jgi:hypothetical protein
LKRVSVLGRVIDLAGLTLLVGGGTLWARAWLGFRSLPDYRRDPGGEVWATVQIADGYGRLQTIGVGLMILGIAVFVAAWWFAGRSGGKPSADHGLE